MILSVVTFVIFILMTYIIWPKVHYITKKFVDTPPSYWGRFINAVAPELWRTFFVPHILCALDTFSDVFRLVLQGSWFRTLKWYI